MKPNSGPDEFETNPSSRPRSDPGSDLIVVTAGEPAGIGPEICLALADIELAPRITVIADPDMMSARADQVGSPVQLVDYRAGSKPAPGQLQILPEPLAEPAVAGQLNTANAESLLRGLRKEVAALPEQPNMTKKGDVSTETTIMRFLESAKTTIFSIEPPLIVASFIINKAYALITAFEKIFKAAKQAGGKKTFYVIAATLGFFLALYLSFLIVFISMFLPLGDSSLPWLLFRVIVVEVFLAFLAMPAVRILPLKWLKRMSPIQTFIISFLIVIYPLYGVALLRVGLAIFD